MIDKAVNTATGYCLYGFGGMFAWLSSVNWIAVLSLFILVSRFIYDTVQFRQWLKDRRKYNANTKRKSVRSTRRPK